MDTVIVSDVHRLKGYDTYNPDGLCALSEEWKAAVAAFANHKKTSALPFIKTMLEVAVRHNSMMHCYGGDYVDHQPIGVTLSALQNAAKLSNQGRKTNRFSEKSLLQATTSGYSSYEGLLKLADRLTSVLIRNSGEQETVKHGIHSRFSERRSELGLTGAKSALKHSLHK